MFGDDTCSRMYELLEIYKMDSKILGVFSRIPARLFRGTAFTPEDDNALEHNKRTLGLHMRVEKWV